MAVVLSVATLVCAVMHDIRAAADMAMVGDDFLYHDYKLHHHYLQGDHYQDSRELLEMTWNGNETKRLP